MLLATLQSFVDHSLSACYAAVSAGYHSLFLVLDFKKCLRIQISFAPF